ncbi:methyltransferase domain-containing protein [Longispora fulva]|uniref:SAM-dependent methyltransferase n=1 Tax=Longispora fulva TaxID=619741 RepID=A0A8J7GJY9_9ACTN|nr:methyltransferase domain-containing protein [Longispora fulva]MBG6140859.1 SAM-dependent methyltransferase [Longispora fulva]
MYTHGHHDSVLRSHRWRTAENSAGYLLRHLAPGQSLLDVGCGPGTITVDLAERVAPGRVVGVDASAEVLEEARALSEPAVGRVGGGGGAPAFVVGDVMALEFADASFDVVHAHQVLQHLADPVGALRELRRVSRGVVAARDADYAAMTWYPRVPALDDWLALYQRVARDNGGEPDAGRRLLSWARAAGFAEVTPGASVWCYATPEDRAWWGDLWADRMVDSALARQAVARGFAGEADLRAIASGWREWAGSPDGWFLVPHGEVLAWG